MTTPSDRDHCYFCESTDGLEVHHIVPQRLGGSDARDNLVTLCHDCHWKLERLYNKDFYEALGIEDPRTTSETHITCEFSGCADQSTEKMKIKGATIYRCKKHAEEDTLGTLTRSELENSIMSFLSNHPNEGFSPNTITDEIDAEAAKADVKDALFTLRLSGKVEMVPKFGKDAWKLSPNWSQ